MITWQPEDSVESYRIYITNENGFSSVVDSNEPKYLFKVASNDRDAYTVRVEGRNVCGSGPKSPPLKITFSTPPEQILPVVVVRQGCSAVISWTAPDAQGSKIE